MAKNIFLASDHHMGHENMLNFKREDGSPLRVFDNVDHMNETIIERHNSVVKPGDRVYFLGDFCFSHKHLHFLDRMNGDKVLIKGNHDKLKLSQYLPYFDDVRGSHQFDGMILTHIPIHPDSLARWGCNVHGHLHSYNVRLPNKQLDKRYFCVCLEQLDYTPISLEELKKRINLQT